MIDKFLLFLYSLTVFLLTAVGLAIAFEWVSANLSRNFLDAVYSVFATKYAVIAVCAILLLLSSRFLYLSLRKNREHSGSIDQRTDFGDIRISLETVENLALKAASRVRGLKDLRARVRVSDSGLELQLRSVFDGEASIPQLSEEVQRGVKEHIEEVTGIPVASITVYIANVAQSQSFKARVE